MLKQKINLSNVVTEADTVANDILRPRASSDGRCQHNDWLCRSETSAVRPEAAAVSSVRHHLYLMSPSHIHTSPAPATATGRLHSKCHSSTPITELNIWWNGAMHINTCFFLSCPMSKAFSRFHILHYFVIRKWTRHRNFCVMFTRKISCQTMLPSCSNSWS